MIEHVEVSEDMFNLMVKYKIDFTDLKFYFLDKNRLIHCERKEDIILTNEELSTLLNLCLVTEYEFKNYFKQKLKSYKKSFKKLTA